MACGAIAVPLERLAGVARKSAGFFAPSDFRAGFDLALFESRVRVSRPTALLKKDSAKRFL